MFNLGSKVEFIMGISSPTQIGEFLERNPNHPGLIFSGKSNVGKSTLINALFGQSSARTSKHPGRTRQINVFRFHIKKGEQIFPCHFFDLPGYGYAKVSKEMHKEWEQLLHIFFENISNSNLIINIQDARTPNTKVDQSFYQYISRYENQLMLVFNKIDKLKTQRERAQLSKSKDEIYKTYKKAQQIYFLSALKKDQVPLLTEALKTFLFTKI